MTASTDLTREADAEAFVCAICRHETSLRWNGRGRDRLIPPLCRFCETQYTQGIAMPSAGSFRDRREVRRGFAIAEALRTAARHKEHGYAIA